jgi:hypothetical protein
MSLDGTEGPYFYSILHEIKHYKTYLNFSSILYAIKYKKLTQTPFPVKWEFPNFDREYNVDIFNSKHLYLVAI